jgi:hypothetical protein
LAIHDRAVPAGSGRRKFFVLVDFAKAPLAIEGVAPPASPISN